MRRFLLIALAWGAGCAHLAPEDTELWVPRGHDVPAVGELEGADVYVPADASRGRTDFAQDDRPGARTPHARSIGPDDARH